MSLITGLIIFISSLASIPALAASAKKCFSFKAGNQEVSVGWFQRKTFNVQKICLQGNYAKMGFNSITVTLTESGYSAGRSGADVVYKASLERFSATQARFTLSDGEPEPTQWEATFEGQELVSIDFERRRPSVLVPIQ
jgi:hypothetical protein